MISIALIIPLLTGVLMNAPSLDNPEPDSVADVIRALRQRNERLDSIRCEYLLDTTLTEAEIAERARSEKRTRDDVRQQYAGEPSECAFWESRQGFFAFELKKARPRIPVEGTAQGNLERRRSLRYDGNATYMISDLIINGESRTPSVTLNSEIRNQYEAETPVRRLLGDTVLPIAPETPIWSTPLYHQLQSAGRSALLPVEQIDGADCYAVRWSKESEQATHRETVWLDKERGLVLRRYTQETRPNGKDAWTLVKRGNVTDVASTPLTSASQGPTTEYWYPQTTQWELFNAEGRHTLTNTITILALKLDEALGPQKFTPWIEDGTTVVDASRNRSFVYGGDLSPRLRRLVERRVEESRREVAAKQDADAEDRVMTPGPHWMNVASWTALACGAVGLLAGLWLRRRG